MQKTLESRILQQRTKTDANVTQREGSFSAALTEDNHNNNYLGSTIANVCVILGVLAFGFTVSYVLKAAGAQHR